MLVFDPLYFLIVGPGMLLALWASWRVKSTFHRYADLHVASGLSGAEVAHELLRRSALLGVRVELHEGFLSDHYDPSDRVVRLSSDVYHGRFVGITVKDVIVALHVVQTRELSRLLA